MRKLLSAVVVVASSISLFHCASGGKGSSADAKDAGTGDDTTNVTSSHDAGKPPPPAQDAAPPARDASFDAADARGALDAAKPAPPPKPSAACSALATCCSALTSSTEAATCFVAIDYTAGHSLLNSVECAATYALLNCSEVAATQDLGPSCGQLAACCNSQAYGQYLSSDNACTNDWRAGSEELCDSDLQYYYNDDYGDCL